jgi:hypothetical protein
MENNKKSIKKESILPRKNRESFICINTDLSKKKGSFICFNPILLEDIKEEKDEIAMKRGKSLHRDQNVIIKLLVHIPKHIILLDYIDKLSKDCEYDFKFESKMYLEYEQDEAFIFIYNKILIITHLFTQKELDNTNISPILYQIPIENISYVDMQYEEEGNVLIIQYIDDNMFKKSEMYF